MLGWRHDQVRGELRTNCETKCMGYDPVRARLGQCMLYFVVTHQARKDREPSGIGRCPPCGPLEIPLGHIKNGTERLPAGCRARIIALRKSSEKLVQFP